VRDVGLQFARVRAGGETLWHVHRAGRFIGSIAEVEGGYLASRLVDGEVRTQRFPNRDAAARWLTKLAGSG
jgi:hypothetical protein